MKLIKATALALMALPAVLMTSCGGNGRTSDSDSAIVSDSLPADSATLAKRDSIAQAEAPERKFPTTESALDFMRNSGHWAEYEAGILPRMASENLEYAGKLLNNKYKHFIVVDKAAMKVILYNKYGKMVKEYGCACAKNYGTKHRKADSRTPEGFFTAEGIYNSTDWLFTNDAGYTSPARGQFGPRFIRLKTPVSSQIGIHGTAAPGSIGRRVSHGCIRITNENILELVKYAEVGMPIIVSPGPRDMRVNMDEGYNVPAVTTGAEPIKAAEPTVDKKKKDTDKAAAKTSKKETKANETTAPAEGENVKETPAEEKKGSAEEKKAPAEEKKAPAEEKKTTPEKPATPVKEGA